MTIYLILIQCDLFLRNLTDDNPKRAVKHRSQIMKQRVREPGPGHHYKASLTQAESKTTREHD